jgi:DNA processing protein
MNTKISPKISSTFTLSKADREAMIAFLAVPGIGRKTFRMLEHQITEMGISLSELWERGGDCKILGFGESKREALEIFKQKYTPAGFIRFLDKKKIRVMTIYDKDYPKLLKEIDDPPLTLYIMGGKIEQKSTAISVVGTRKMTKYGERVIEKIVGELVGQGVMIVSGFMYGVDYQAHQVALDYGGQTLGVLGFGFDHIFPRSFAGKFEQMLERGMTFITEYPPFIQARKGCFPERNRIVAGLSAGTIVIEAAARSGTSITANLAAEYGRDVFAIPGSIFSPYSEGTRVLINNGAYLVESGYEVLEEVGEF